MKAIKNNTILLLQDLKDDVAKSVFSEIEGFLYGGPDAVTWFVAAVQKANWMILPVTVINSSGFFRSCLRVTRFFAMAKIIVLNTELVNLRYLGLF